MDWPACSPDLNQIENFWDHLERQVRENHPPPATLPAVLGLLQQEWLAIPHAFLGTSSGEDSLHNYRGRPVVKKVYITARDVQW